jgi:hypothetical protein
MTFLAYSPTAVNDIADTLCRSMPDDMQSQLRYPWCQSKSLTIP